MALSKVLAERHSWQGEINLAYVDETSFTELRETSFSEEKRNWSETQLSNKSNLLHLPEIINECRKDVSAKSSPKETKTPAEPEICVISNISSKMTCQSCKAKGRTKKATYYCSDCSEYQCECCSDAHKELTKVVHHKIVSSIHSDEHISRNNAQKWNICKIHGEQLKYFCEEEDKICCGTCTSVDHSQCKSVIDIQGMKFHSNILMEMDSIKTEILDVSAMASKVFLDVKQQKNKFNADAAVVLNKIQTLQENVLETFRNMKRVVVKEIEWVKKDAFKDFDVKQSTCKEYVNFVEQSLSEMEAVTKSGTQVQQFLFTRCLRDRIKELQSKFKAQQRTLKSIVLDLEVDNVLALPPAIDIPPGKLSVKYEKPEELKWCIDWTLRASVDLLKDADNVNEPLYTGLSFLENGRIVAVDNKNDKCDVFSETLERIVSFPLTYKPQDVVVVRDDKIVITTGRDFRLEWYHISESNEITKMHNCKVEGEYSTICIVDEEHFLMGSVDDDQPVRMLKMTGEQRSLSVKFPDKRYSVRQSSSTYIRKYNKIAISDRYLNTIFIYDVDSNNSVEIKDDTVISEPRGIAVGPEDCVFVCSAKTNSLVQISHDGKILDMLQLSMEYPCRVAFSKDERLLAVTNACFGHKKLQVFAMKDNALARSSRANELSPSNGPRNSLATLMELWGLL